MLQCKGVRICYNAKRGEYVTMQRGKNILQCKGVRIYYNPKGGEYVTMQNSASKLQVPFVTRSQSRSSNVVLILSTVHSELRLFGLYLF